MLRIAGFMLLSGLPLIVNAQQGGETPAESVETPVVVNEPEEADIPENAATPDENIQSSKSEKSPAVISGKGGLGLIVNRGNTNNENFNASLQLVSESESWKHAFGIDARKTTEGNTTIAERYVYTEKSDYTLSEYIYIFGALRYDDDRFSGFRYQASVTSGFGWRVIDNERTRFELELGGGYKQSKLETADTYEEETIGRFGEQFRIQLTESTQFSQNLLAEWGDEQTISEFKAALNVSMNNYLAIQIGYNIKHTSNPPLNREDTDRSTSVNLVYSF